MSELSLTGTLVRVGIGTTAFLVGTWASMGKMVVEKVATALLQPVGILWLLIICGVVLAVNSRRRPFIAITVAALVLLSVAGNAMFADWLARTREGPFADIRPLEQQPFDAVVVLGGGAMAGMNDRSQGNQSGDRLILAAELYHNGIAKRLICTGKQIAELTNNDRDPSQLAFEMLTSLGVPGEAIEQFGGRNTSEEMRELGRRFENTQERVGVLTSAWHLPRVLELARRNGFEPQPLPADFLTQPADVPRTTAEVVLLLVPKADALQSSSKIAKEYLGILVGR